MQQVPVICFHIFLEGACLSCIYIKIICMGACTFVWSWRKEVLGLLLDNSLIESWAKKVNYCQTGHMLNAGVCKLLNEIRRDWNGGRNETAMICIDQGRSWGGKTIISCKFWLGKSYWNHRIIKVEKHLQDQAQPLTKCMIAWTLG